jgi:hypothetical protein
MGGQVRTFDPKALLQAFTHGFADRAARFAVNRFVLVVGSARHDPLRLPGLFREVMANQIENTKNVSAWDAIVRTLVKVF